MNQSNASPIRPHPSSSQFAFSAIPFQAETKRRTSAVDARRISVQSCIRAARYTLLVLCVAYALAQGIGLSAKQVDVVGVLDSDVESQAGAHVDVDPTLWRYTADGWHTIDEMRTVATPRRQWIISDCHPLIVACLQVLAACFLLAALAPERHSKARFGGLHGEE